MKPKKSESKIQNPISVDFEYHNLNSEEKDSLIDDLKLLIEERNEIIFSILHGSFQTDSDFRDIDIAIYLNRPTNQDIFDYTIKFAAELEGKVRLPIDIQVLNEAPLPFRYIVADTGMVLTCRDTVFYEEFVNATTREYLDFKYFCSLYS
ncbi:MAG: Nucleotidyltransferase domain protein [Candidatus Thorarchaeota archaeon]|nr:MAG: Nucleotidyltransferase domain protein [Candidatus Thorarchaeota archaeon]